MISTGSMKITQLNALSAPRMKAGSTLCGAPRYCTMFASYIHKEYILQNYLLSSTVMDKQHWINFRDLPHSAGGLSELFTDYVNDFPKVQQFFQTDFHSVQNFEATAEQTCSRFKYRQQIVEILLEQNQNYGASEATLENIRSLGHETTLAVLTGQQVGILGGPLYTIYKTITSIKLAQQLRETFPQYKFVPVFWLEGEDHDFDEVSGVGLLNADRNPVKVEYLPNGKHPDKNVGAVGELVLDGYVQSFFESIQKTLQNSEFKSSVIELAERAYSSGSTLNKAFVVLLNKLFHDSGMVFISSNDKRIKQLLSPVFQKEIQEYPRVSQLIIQRSAELEDRYHAQIKTKALNLFLFHKGGRYLIEPRENDFSLKGIRHYFTRDELVRIATEAPESLSPNVALRPICQDTILPTIAYIGGPSEIAYFAQLKPVYNYFNLIMPVIYPRASVTMIDEKLERILEKYQLDLTEFFDGIEKVNHKVVEMVSEVKIDEMFSEAESRLNDLVNEMKFGINYIDSTLLGPLEHTQSKVAMQFQSLKEKVAEAQQRKHEIALRQIEKVGNIVFPNGNFQERELNIMYFMNKYGTEFVKWLMGEIHIGQFEHQILHLP